MQAIPRPQGFLIFWRLMLKAGGPADTESRLLYFVMRKLIIALLITVTAASNAQIPTAQSVLTEATTAAHSFAANIIILPTVDTPFIYLPGPVWTHKPKRAQFFDIVVKGRAGGHALSIDDKGKLVVTDSLQAIQGLLLYIYYNEKRMK